MTPPGHLQEKTMPSMLIRGGETDKSAEDFPNHDAVDWACGAGE